MASKSVYFKALVLLVTFSSAICLKRQADSDLHCLKCDHVDTPTECDTFSICGHGELCFTREFTDHHDKLAYHMGCESSEICALYKNAEQIFLGVVGRRDLQEVDDVQNCFDCCNTAECNKGLCSGTKPSGTLPTAAPVVTLPPPLTTAVPTPGPIDVKTTIAGTSNGCQSSFVQWINSCYLFSLDNLNWDDARQACQSHGADLVSVNSQLEDTFIVNHLNDMHPPDTVRGIWLGGIYNEQDSKFQWVDGSDVTFNRFKTGSPRNQKEYRLNMINPDVHALFAGWPWGSDIGSIYKRGYICEVKSTN